jgi:hypothetical protein
MADSDGDRHHSLAPVHPVIPSDFGSSLSCPRASSGHLAAAPPSSAMNRASLHAGKRHREPGSPQASSVATPAGVHRPTCSYRVTSAQLSSCERKLFRVLAVLPWVKDGEYAVVGASRQSALSLILQPVTRPVLPASCNSLLLVAASSRQLREVMTVSCSSPSTLTE